MFTSKPNLQLSFIYSVNWCLFPKLSVTLSRQLLQRCSWINGLKFFNSCPTPLSIQNSFLNYSNKSSHTVKGHFDASPFLFRPQLWEGHFWDEILASRDKGDDLWRLMLGIVKRERDVVKWERYVQCGDEGIPINQNDRNRKLFLSAWRW